MKHKLNPFVTCWPVSQICMSFEIFPQHVQSKGLHRATSVCSLTLTLCSVLPLRMCHTKWFRIHWSAGHSVAFLLLRSPVRQRELSNKQNCHTAPNQDPHLLHHVIHPVMKQQPHSAVSNRHPTANQKQVLSGIVNSLKHSFTDDLILEVKQKLKKKKMKLERHIWFIIHTRTFSSGSHLCCQSLSRNSRLVSSRSVFHALYGLGV